MPGKTYSMLHFFIGRGYEDTDEDTPRYYATDMPLVAEAADGTLYGLYYNSTEERNLVYPAYSVAKDVQYYLVTDSAIIHRLQQALAQAQFVKTEGGRSIYLYENCTIKQDFTPPRWYQYKFYLPI